MLELNGVDLENRLGEIVIMLKEEFLLAHTMSNSGMSLTGLLPPIRL